MFAPDNFLLPQIEFVLLISKERKLCTSYFYFEYAVLVFCLSKTDVKLLPAHVKLATD